MREAAAKIIRWLENKLETQKEDNGKVDPYNRILGKPGLQRFVNLLLLGILLIGVPLFFASFHIVTRPFIVIAKEQMTFADTLVNVDEYLERYNKAPLFERMKLRTSKIHRALEEKGAIVSAREN